MGVRLPTMGFPFAGTAENCELDPASVLPDMPEHLREMLAVHLFGRFLGFREKQLSFRLIEGHPVLCIEGPPTIRIAMQLGAPPSRRGWTQQILKDAEVALQTWRERVRGLSREKKSNLAHVVTFHSKICASFPKVLATLVVENITLPRGKDPDVEACVSTMLRIAMSKLPPEMSYLSLVDREALAVWTLLRVGGVPEDHMTVKVETINDERLMCLEVSWRDQHLALGLAVVPGMIADEDVLRNWQSSLALYKQVSSEVRAVLVVESRLSRENDFSRALINTIEDVVDRSQIINYLQTVRAEQGIS